MIDPILYIHVGLHKTGSTFLQRCFFSNYDKLISQGFLFPRTGFLDLEDQGGDRFTTSGHDLFVKAALTRNVYYRSLLLDSLAEEIKVTRARAVLLSAENFTNHQIGDLSREVRSLFKSYSNIRIIISLRNVYDWIDSYYRDRVASGWEFERNEICSFIEKNKILIYPAQHIANWSDTFGKNKIDVVVWGRSLKGMGIINFYANFFKIDCEMFDCDANFMNQGSSNEFVNTVLFFNKRVFPGFAARRSIVTVKNELKSQRKKSSLLTKQSILLIDKYINFNIQYLSDIAPVIGNFSEFLIKHHVEEDSGNFDDSIFSALMIAYKKETKTCKDLLYGFLFVVYSYLPLRLRVFFKRTVMKYK